MFPQLYDLSFYVDTCYVSVFILSLIISIDVPNTEFSVHMICLVCRCVQVSFLSSSQTYCTNCNQAHYSIH